MDVCQITMGKRVKWLRFTVQRIDGFIEIITKSVCWLILVLMSITFYDVVMRYFFNAPTIWAYELVGLLFAPLWLLTGAYLLSHNEHVRMDIFYRHLSPRKKAIMDLVTYTLFLFYSISILVYGWEWFCLSFTRQDHSQTIWRPILWPFKVFIPIGVGLLLFAGLAKYIRDLYIAITGRVLE